MTPQEMKEAVQIVADKVKPITTEVIEQVQGAALYGALHSLLVSIVMTVIGVACLIHSKQLEKNEPTNSDKVEIYRVVGWIFLALMLLIITFALPIELRSYFFPLEQLIK